MESLYEKSKEELINEINNLRNTAEHLEQADMKFEVLAEKSLVGVYLIRDDLFRYVNPKLAQIFGYTVDEIINKLGPKDLVFPEDKQIVEENIRKRINGEIQSANYVFRGSKKDGSEIYIEVFGSRTLVDNKPSIIGTLLDITDKTRMELGLRENELKYRNLFEQSPVSLWEEDFSLLKIFLDGIMETGIDDLRKYFDENPEIVRKCSQMVEVINVNNAAVKLHRAKSKENLIGNLNKVFTEKSYEAFKEELIAVAEGKDNVIAQGEVRTLDGEIRYVIVDANISYKTRNGEASTTAIVAISDITERKQAEEAIIESKQMLDDVFNTIPVRVFWKDTEGVYLGCNNLFARDAGRRNPDDIVGDNDYNMGWTEQAELYRSDDRQVIESGKPKINYEEPQTTPEGKLIWLNTSKIPLLNSNGSVYGVLGTYEDITDRKKVEKELLESRELYRVSIESAPYGIVVISKDGEFLISNNQLVIISGYNKNEIQDLNTWFNKLYPDEEYRKEIIKSYSKPLDESGSTIREAEITRKDGERRTCQFVVSNLPSGSRIIFVEDITERKLAEQTLKDKEYLLRKSQMVANLGTYDLDITGSIWKSSPILDDIFGVDANQSKDLYGWLQIVHPEDRDMILDYFETNVLKDHESFNKEYRIKKFNDQEDRWVHGLGELEFDDDGNPIRMIGTIQDITDRKNAEKAMLESEKNLSLIYDTVGDIIFQLSVEPEDDFRFLSVNKKFLETTGLTAEQIIGKKYDEVIPEPERNFVLKNYKKAINERRTIQWEETSKYPTGELTGIISVSPFFDEGGECKYLIGSVHNITERKIAENNLIQSEESYRGLFNNATDSIYIQDIEGRFLDVNEGAIKLYGYTREEFIGRTPEFLSAPGKNDLKKLDEHIKKTLDGIPQQFEFYGRKKDGTVVPKIVRLQKGKYFGKEVIIAFAMDITERKIAEARIAGLANILESSLNEIYIIDDVTLNFIQANKGARKNLGYSNYELEHLTPVDIKPEHNRETFEQLIAPLRSGEKNIINFETVHKRKDGSQYPVEVHMQLIQHEDKSVFVAFILDISERKKGEIALQKSEESLKLAQEFGKVGSWDWDIVNDKLTWSDQAFIQMGLKPNEVEPTSNIFESLIHPDDKELVKNAIEKSFQFDEPYSVEVRMIKPGGTEWIMHTAGKAIRDKDGNPIRFAGVQQDITERRLAEEEIRKLSHSVEQSPAIVIITDNEGIVEYVNPKFVEVTGYAPDEMIGRKTNVLKSSDTSQDEYKVLWDTIKSGGVWQGEFHNKKKSGELYWESATISGIKNAAGEIAHFVAIKEDITKRKEAENEIVKLAKFPSENPNPVLRIAQDGKIVFSNKASTALLEKWNYVEGQPLSPEWNAFAERALESTHIQQTEVDCNGTVYSLVFSPVKESEFVNVYGLDITERKFAENILIESEEKFRNLADNSPNMIFINKGGRVVYANRVAEQVTGYRKEEFYSTDFDFKTLVEPGYLDLLLSNFKAHMEGTEVPPYEYSIVTKPGNIINSIISTKLIMYGGEKAILGIITDITDRKKAEMALLESEAKWRSITENSPDHIMLLDSDANILFMNRSVPGLNKEEVLGKPVYKFVPKEFHNIAQERFETAFKVGKTQSYETKYQSKDGDLHYFSVRLGPVYKEGKIVALVSSSTDITKEKKTENRLIDSYVRLRNLAERLQMVREEERASVAREIHDDLGQSLTALKMDIAWLKNHSEMNEEEKNSKIDTMLNLTNSTIQTVKRIATQLRPGILDDLGLVPAIEWQAEEFQNRFNIQCNLTVNRKDVILKDEISIAIFRIFQETLTNVARHSGATEINIDLNFKDNNELVLEIVDNGKGIDKVEIYSPKSFGLFGMKERVNILNGKMKIVGKKDKGTKVSVFIPY